MYSRSLPAPIACLGKKFPFFINMGRSPCCSKESVNRGAWAAEEDKILSEYIRTHGEGGWKYLPKKAGLNRCGKSCRLRWLNYLRPDIKRGNISPGEEELIIRMHRLLGNRWALIAGRLPGRTDNEIKNHWNTRLSKKLPESRNFHTSKSSCSFENDQVFIKTSPVIIPTAERHFPTLEPNNAFNNKVNTSSDCKCLENLNEDFRPWMSPHTEEHWRLDGFTDEKHFPSMDNMIKNLDDSAHITDMGSNWCGGQCWSTEFGAQRDYMEPQMEEQNPFQLSYMEVQDNCLAIREMDASNQLKSIMQLLELEDEENEEEPILLPIGQTFQ